MEDEEEEVTTFVRDTCGCKLANGSPSHEELDMALLEQISNFGLH